MTDTCGYLSPDGTLPEPVAMALCQRVHERSPELVLEHVGAALDGDGAIAAVWVGFAAPCLDRPERVRDPVRGVRETDRPVAVAHHEGFLAAGRQGCRAPVLAGLLVVLHPAAA